MKSETRKLEEAGVPQPVIARPVGGTDLSTQPTSKETGNMTATKKAPAKKAAPRKAAPAAKKTAAPAKAAAKKAEPVPAKPPTVPEGATAVHVEPPRDIVLGAVTDALKRLPTGSKSRRDGEFLIVAKDEGQAVVVAITEFMRAIVAENRSAGMYREGKLRGVRTAVLAAVPGLEVPKAARASNASTKTTDGNGRRVSVLTLAKQEKRAVKEWESTPEADRGPKPATPTLDQINAEYEAKEAKAAARRQAAAPTKAPAAKKASDPVEPRFKDQARKAS